MDTHIDEVEDIKTKFFYVTFLKHKMISANFKVKYCALKSLINNNNYFAYSNYLDFCPISPMSLKVVKDFYWAKCWEYNGPFITKNIISDMKTDLKKLDKILIFL